MRNNAQALTNLVRWIVLHGNRFTVFATYPKMNALLDEIMVDGGQHAEKFREKIAFEVLLRAATRLSWRRSTIWQGGQTVNNWVAKYRERIKSGLVTLPPMNAKEKESLQAMKLRVRELEKALEHANVFIYGLNSMIDYAEKELEVPIRKSVVPSGDRPAR